MMKKGNRREAIQLLLMILLTGFSQIIALYKSSYTATRFGASTQMDAYNFATNIASFLFLFITSGITTVVIPAYIKKESAKVINTFITSHLCRGLSS
jgi:putative peptidoglycan lipid II flippase